MTIDSFSPPRRTGFQGLQWNRSNCGASGSLWQISRALDDDVNRSLPFAVGNPNWPNVPITWRMLLTHTSSIDHTGDALIQALDYWGKDQPLAFDDYVKARFLPGGKYHIYELFRSGKPGSERIYSNDGFSLLAFALESPRTQWSSRA